MLTFEINLHHQIEKRLKFLIEKYANKKAFFKELISYQIKQLEQAIFNIEKDLRQYEKQYQLSSKEFYELFTQGKYGDEDDYMIWSGLYELNKKNKSELKQLQW